MKIPVRLFLGAFFLLLSFFVLKSVSFAQATDVIQPQQNLSNMATNTNPDVPNNLHNWTQTVLIEVISAASCAMSGMDPTNPNQQCLGVDQKTNKIGFVPNGGGAIGIMASSLSTIFTPPLHTGDYLSYLSKNFGLAKTSYAAVKGTGFDQLSPIMGIWIAFRNITYAFFVIIFLVIGIAIMLRVRIDPRTVMTIQNQIPKIIIGIVMVTFSFAIAGFLIDLMWTSMYVSYSTLVNVPKSGGLVGLDPTSMQGNTPLGIMDKFTTSGGNSLLTQDAIDTKTMGIFGISNQVAMGVQDVFRESLGVDHCTDVLGCFAANFNVMAPVLDLVTNKGPVNILIDLVSWVTGFSMFMKAYTMTAATTETLPFGIGTVVDIFAGTTGGIVVGTGTYALTQYILRNFAPWLIVFLIINLAIFVALIRLWFELLKAYMFILFDIILAPFWIMAGLIPGNTAVNFSSWLKDLVANLAAFPAVAVMFMLGNIIMTGFRSPTSPPFVPPLVGNPGNTDFLSALIGLSVILSTPTVVSMVKKAIKAPNLGLGAVSQGISAGTSIIKSGVGGVTSYVMKTPAMDKKGGLGAVFRKSGLA